MEDSKKTNYGGQYNKDDKNLELSENIETNDNLCCICYNKNLTLFLNCNHVICLECITNIKKLCCPLCRAELSYLPKKIINIINSDSTNLGISNSNYNYLSLLHNVRPLSLSSSPLSLSSINPGLSSINTGLSSITSNVQQLPLSMSFTHNSHVDNDISLYEQYFNEFAFIDIDDFIHYGFINGEEDNDRNGDDDRNSNNDRNGDDDNIDRNEDNEDNDRYNRYSRYFDRTNESDSDRSNNNSSYDSE